MQNIRERSDLLWGGREVYRGLSNKGQPKFIGFGEQLLKKHSPVGEECACRPVAVSQATPVLSGKGGRVAWGKVT
jgi:hypothetical protein